MKGGVFFLPFSYIFILFLPFQLPTPELGLAYMPPPRRCQHRGHKTRRAAVLDFTRCSGKELFSAQIPSPSSSQWPSSHARENKTQPRGERERRAGQIASRNPPSLPGTAGDAAGQGATRRLGATGRTAA